MQMNLTQKLELAFWDVIIYRLSRYSIVRKILHYGYSMAENFDKRAFLKVAAVVALCGFLSGFGFTLVFSMIF
jgi:hypothetical protein